MRKSFLLPSFIGCLAFCVGVIGVGLQSLADPPLTVSSCSSGQQCFQSALRTEAQGAVSPPDLLRLFHRVQQQYPGTSWGRRAGIRIGLILRDEDPSMAQQYFRAGLQDYPLLEDYFRMWIGETWRQMGEVRRAAQEYQSILALEPATPVHTEAAFQGGHAWFEVGDCQQATALLDQALSLSSDSPWAAQAWFDLVQCGIIQKQPARVEQGLKFLWRNDPEFYQSREVQHVVDDLHMQGVEWAPSLDDRLARVQTLMKTAQFQQAVDDLRQMLSGEVTTPTREKFLYTLAMAYVRLKDYPQAEKVFRRLSRGHTAYAGKSTVWLARVYLRQDKGGALLAMGKEKISKWFQKSQQAKVVWMGGLWLEDHKRYDEALTAYHRAETLGRGAQVGLDASWRAGWLHYQLGEYQQASQTFQTLEKRVRNGSLKRQASYWAARSLAHLGQKTGAAALYRQLAEAFPLTYYGQLARLHVDATPLKTVQKTVQTDMARLSLKSIKASLPSFHGEAAYLRAMDLTSLGLREEATRELLALSPEYGSDAETFVHLAHLLVDNGAYHEAIRMASRFGPSGQLSQEPSLKILAYPVGYFSTIQEFSKAWVDPYLVSGIIREESLYNAQALSRVGAMGLMQLMPETAKRVARTVGVSWQGGQELFRPEMNIQLGTVYLGQLVRQFNGNLIHAIAAYNAGPKPVRRWIARFGHLAEDEFVEHISYKETRGYVKRVLTSYHVYRDMVPTICGMKYLDTLC